MTLPVETTGLENRRALRAPRVRISPPPPTLPGGEYFRRTQKPFLWRRCNWESVDSGYHKRLVRQLWQTELPHQQKNEALELIYHLPTMGISPASP